VKEKPEKGDISIRLRMGTFLSGLDTEYRDGLTCKRLRIINTLRLYCIDVGTALVPPYGCHGLAIILGSQKLLQ